MTKRGQARELSEEEQSWLEDLVDPAEEETDELTAGDTDTGEQEAGDTATDELDVGEQEEALQTSGEEETGEEQVADEEQVATKGEDDPKFKAVLAELQEERKKRQEAETKNIKYETYWEIQEREARERAEAAKGEEQDTKPDFDMDPTGHLKASLDEVTGELKETKQQNQQRAQMEALGNAIKQSEMGFVAEHPDYYDALEHVRNVARQTNGPVLKAQGFNDAQIDQYLAQQEIGVAAQVLQVGQNPAEYAYNIAKAYGYVPKDATDTDTGDGGQETDPNKEKLDQMEKGLKMSRTGHGSGKTMSKQEIDNMTLPEFEAAMAEVFPTQH